MNCTVKWMIHYEKVRTLIVCNRINVLVNIVHLHNISRLIAWLRKCVDSVGQCSELIRSISITYIETSCYSICVYPIYRSLSNVQIRFILFILPYVEQ